MSLPTNRMPGDIIQAVDINQIAEAVNNLSPSDVGAAPASHGHAIDDVAGLRTELDGKQPSGSYASTTHNHASSDVTDFSEAVDDRVASLIVPGSGLTKTYDDAAGSLTLGLAHELRGTGMPDGQVTAPPGTYYTDTAGTNGAWRWLKKLGTGNIGWQAISGSVRRRVNDLLMNGWSASVAYLARDGDTVSLSVYSLNGGAATGNAFLTLPMGFRNNRVNAAITPITGGWTSNSMTPNPLIYLSNYSNGECMTVARPGGGLILSEWQTADPWPTTLPGVSA